MKHPRRHDSLIEAVSESACLVVLIVLPVFFNLSVERVFEEEKALFLRAGAPLVAILLVAGAARHSRIWRHPVVVALVLLSGVLGISAAMSIAPRDSWFGSYFRRHGVATWAALITIFVGLAAAGARSPAARDRIWQATILGSVWPSVYAVCQAFGVDPIEWTDIVPGRAGGTAGNALLFGGYLAVLLPMTACTCLRPALAMRTRVCYATVLILQAAALVATGSLGPLVAAAGGTAAGVLVLLAARRPRLAGAIVVLLLVSAGTAAATSRLVATSFGSGSGRVRVLIWQGLSQSLRETTGRLWLGYGPETVRLVSPKYYDAEIADIEGTEAMPDRAHNETLDTLVSAGAIGVVAELALFAAVLWSAFRLPDPFLRAPLLAGVIAHVAEIQLGIATVMSRLAFLSIAALVVALRDTSPAEASGSPVSSRFAGLSLTAAAVMLLAAFANPGATALYLIAVAMAGGLTLTLMTGHHSRREYLVAAVAVIAPTILARPIALTASRADGLNRAGRSLERSRNWATATAAYRAAVDLQPAEPHYLTALGRTLLERGAEMPPEQQRRWFDEGEHMLTRARTLDPLDPNHLRNLAGAARRRARAVEAAERSPFLAQADRYYEQATALSPGMQPLWIEWANLAAEQRQFDVALARLDRAEQLRATNIDLWSLRGLVRLGQRRLPEAVAAYDRALAIRADAPAALRGRAAALAEMGRINEALATVETLLRVAPDDNMGRRMNASLLEARDAAGRATPPPDPSK